MRFKLADELYFINNRGENRVDTFDAHAFRDFADRHGAAHARSADINDKAFKHLDTLLFLALGVEFFNFLVDTDLHAGFDFLRFQDL